MFKIDFLKYFFKTNFVFGFSAFCFSLLGIFSPLASPQNSPLDSATTEHILGHIIWGMMAGILSFSIRGILLSGSFALLLDSDHLINFFGIEAISRMGHSIPFAMLIFVVMLIIFGKKKILLAGISASAIFSHMSFDTFIGSGSFPLFTPFSSSFELFEDYFWVFFQIIAASIVFSMYLIQKNFNNS